MRRRWKERRRRSGVKLKGENRRQAEAVIEPPMAATRENGFHSWWNRANGFR